MKNHMVMKHVLRALLALLFLGLALGGAIRVLADDRYVVGVVSDSRDVTGARQLARVDCPWRESRIVVFPNDMDVERGNLLLAKGESQMMGPFECLVLTQEPVMVSVPRAIRTVFNAYSQWSLVDFLRDHRVVALIAGAVVMLLGCVFLRLLGALALGTIGAPLACLDVAVLDFEGLIAPVPSEVLAGVALSGFAVVVAMGLRRSIVSYLAQCSALLAILLPFAGAVATIFGTEPFIAGGGALLGTLVSPVIGLWLLASALLTISLAAKGLGAYLVLAAVGLTVNVLVGGRWIAKRSRAGRPNRQQTPLSIADLIGG